MSTRDTSSWIETLELTRAELETALAGYADWRVLGRTTSAATRAAVERALADNPVYRAWQLVGQVIEEMRTEEAARAAQAALELATSDEEHGARRRVSLRDVLASIRTDGAGAFDDDPVTPLVAIDPEPATPEAPAPGEDRWSAATPDDLEEATVSIVVRAPETGSDPSPPPAHIDHQVRREGSAPAEDHSGDEAEVTIVPRRR